MALGALAAAAVGYTTSRNHAASPAHLAVLVRVTIIATLVLSGLYAQRSEIHARMGSLLMAAGLASSLWLLNGSADRLLFSVGILCTGVMPVLAAYLMLGYPTGCLRSRSERRFLWITGGATTAVWLVAVVMARQPPLHPLVECTPHCPPNMLSLRLGPAATVVPGAVFGAALIALLCGTVMLLERRARSATAPLRRSLMPVRLAATATAVLLVVYLMLGMARRDLGGPAGGAYLTATVLIPLAIIVGLTMERLFTGQALVDFVNQLARAPEANPEALMAAALEDPSLKIGYRRPALGTYVDASGTPVDVRGHRAVTWIERDHEPVAAVVYGADLVAEEQFIQAAGAAALIRLEKAQLEAELKASTRDLAASRIRLVETADGERRRLERDLHDGIQQHMIGVRIKLDAAAETVKDDPVEAERALARVGREMDKVLEETRSLARGIYPTLLSEHGLREALGSVARSSPIPVEVRAGRIGRYPQDVEIAVYFCCLEALQNVAKHAGPTATATVVLWREGSRLEFKVDDTGTGFDSGQARCGRGLINMRDRIESVGGTLRVICRSGRGVSVRGTVPAR
ncbi:MAG TPA: histidine kinase [Solirubrobacteraceae bacterium]|nr:histidine kinase [Solirubrobacteraceae bacterium]